MAIKVNNLLYFFGFILCIVGGFRVIYIQQYEFKDYLTIELGELSTPLGIIIIFLGFYFLYLFFTFKPQKQKYTICPNCQESYDYKNLDNGKCKYCDNVDTIDIEKYYKDNKEK